MEIPKLYHYTSRAGLLGMFNSKSIWFTDMLYMNDSEEFHYAVEVVKRIIQCNFDDNLTSALNNQTHLKSKHLYTFSLSERKDVLSQWRGYCLNGGYSISFNKEDLTKLTELDYLRFQKCIYKKEEIEALVLKDIVTISPEAYRKMTEDYKAKSQSAKVLSRMPYEIALRAYNVLPFIKHPSFEEEQEWRFVTDTTKDPETNLRFTNEVKFRVGKNLIIPYLNIPIGSQTQNEPFSVDEIIVSPTPLPELSLKVCEKIFPKAKVVLSEIPYRNW